MEKRIRPVISAHAENERFFGRLTGAGFTSRDIELVIFLLNDKTADVPARFTDIAVLIKRFDEPRGVPGAPAIEWGENLYVIVRENVAVTAMFRSDKMDNTFNGLRVQKVVR
jgi:hypothetical protein